MPIIPLQSHWSVTFQDFYLIYQFEISKVISHWKAPKQSQYTKMHSLSQVAETSLQWDFLQAEGHALFNCQLLASWLCNRLYGTGQGSQPSAQHTLQLIALEQYPITVTQEMQWWSCVLEKKKGIGVLDPEYNENDNSFNQAEIFVRCKSIW